MNLGCRTASVPHLLLLASALLLVLVAVAVSPVAAGPAAAATLAPVLLAPLAVVLTLVGLGFAAFRMHVGRL